MEDTDLHAGRAQEGNPDSLQALYARLAPALYTWARLRLRAAPGHAEADDLVQEVWLRALEGFPRFEARSAGSFRAWIFTIAAHVFIEMMRRRGRLGSADTDDLPTQIPAEVTSITQGLRRQESLQQLIEAVNELDPLDRQLVILRGLEGATARDVAESLELGIEAVHKRWQRLRVQLARHPAWQGLLVEN